MIHKIILGLLVVLASACGAEAPPTQDVSAPPVPTPYPAYAIPPNLVSNPGFESGLTGWDDWGNSSVVTSGAYAGTQALRAGTGTGGRGQNINMSPVAGKSFTLKATGKMSISGDIGWVGVHFMVGGQQQAADAKVEFNSTSYASKSITFTVPAGTESIRVWAWKSASSGYLYADEISLVLNESSDPDPLPCSGSGSILLERWDGITLTNPDEIPVGSEPSARSSLTSAEAPTNRGDNYGNRMRGYVCAPVSGNYTFYVAGDNQTALYLSTDENPANKKKIAHHGAWTSPREWTKYATQKSAEISLEAGKRYYIEALQVEQAGGDNLAIGWVLPTGVQEMPIPGNRLSEGPGSGSILLERWDGITLTNPDEIPVGSEPSARSSLTSAEAPTNRGDNYGNRMRGYVHPPVSGNYTFYVAGDDQTALYLSTDENPANKKKIAYHGAWTSPREWTKYATQKSAEISLEAGKRYYIEALQVEQAGGDNLAIGWVLPTGVQEMPIAGSRLSPVSGAAPAPEPNPGYNPSPDVPPQNVSYSGPLVITQGGTYTGNWESRDSEVPAVEVKTSEPVTIINSNIRGAGYLIKSWYHDANLTVKNSRGYGITPTAYTNHKKPRRFVVVDGFRHVTVENNYMEGTAGIVVAGRFVGNGSTETIRIRYNKVKNIDGRIYAGTERVNFVHFRSLKNVPGIEIAYNEVINEPGKSLVEDNINIYNSRGTSSSKIKIHDNFIKGAYPLDLTSSNYTGGGIITDGDGDINTCPSQVEVYGNHLVNLGNYSLGMAGGNNLHYHHNRIFNTGKLPGSSSYWPFYASGMWSNDYYNKGTTFNNLYEYNTVGVLYKGNRNDITANENATYQNNIFLPSGQPTQQQEIDEYQVFLQKLRDKGLTIGPR